MSRKRILIYSLIALVLFGAILVVIRDVAAHEEYHYQDNYLELSTFNSSCTLAIRDILVSYDYVKFDKRPERPVTLLPRVHGKTYTQSAQWFRTAIERADIYLSGIYDGQTTVQPVVAEMKQHIDAHPDMDLDAIIALLDEYEPALREALIVTRRDEKYDDYDLRHT